MTVPIPFGSGGSPFHHRSMMVGPTFYDPLMDQRRVRPVVAGPTFYDPLMDERRYGHLHGGTRRYPYGIFRRRSAEIGGTVQTRKDTAEKQK